MKPDQFVEVLKKEGFSPFTGVPCSVFKHLLNFMATTDEAAYYPATSEGEAMGLAGGFALAGRIPGVIMQVDGYGNAVNPLSSLQLLYHLPCLLLISWRGRPGTEDAPQHRIMGQTIIELLDLFQIPHAVIENGSPELQAAAAKAGAHTRTAATPFALIVPKGYFSETDPPRLWGTTGLDNRAAYLKALAALPDPGDLYVGSTGFSGREMHRILEERKRFYMMGSMGCALSIGLALALEKKEKTVFVLDGDGALLMKLGTLATAGALAPSNLVHLCFDNGQYESTGGQKSAAPSVDLPALARACGYASASTVETVEDFQLRVPALRGQPGPHFLRIRIRPGTLEGLPRPARSPQALRDAFMDGR